MDFIKAEISSDSEACLTSCDSDHEQINVKEDEECVLTFPVQKADNEVDDAVPLYTVKHVLYYARGHNISSMLNCLFMCVCVCVYTVNIHTYTFRVLKIL
jgi:hypothetical protein